MKTRRSLIIVMLAALTMSIAALFFGFQPNTTAHAETTISNTTITADTTWVADTKLSGNIVIKSGVTVKLMGIVRVTQDSSVVISGGGTIKRGNEDAYLNLPGKTNFTLNNVTLDGAKIAAKQPMIFNANSGASLTIQNCTIKDCITTDSQAGGVIRLWQTTLSIDNTTIKDCSGKYYGAIYAAGYGANYAPVSISNSKFYNNSATGARYSAATGGAIYLYLTSTEITNCEFRNNFTQNGSGGAIAVSESTLTLNSGIFTDNVADDLYEDSYSGNGGAISISGSSSVVNVYGGYFLNNKSKGALSDIYSKSNATLNVNLKNLPTREGYTFSGWTDSEENTYPVSQFTVTGKNTDLVAKWDANKYKISYSGMDKATLSPKPEQHTYGTDTKISNPAKTGYTFQGWKVNDKSPAVKNLTLGATAYKSDISLEATWTVNQYQVTLDRQGGSGGTASVTATYKSEMPAIEKLPTRTGYTFQGYFAQPKGAGKRYYDKNGNSAATCDFYVATTLYAHWQANTYTIEYMKNKPSKASNEVAGSTDSSSHIYDQSKALTANGYSLTGYTFRGWAKTATGAAEYTDGASVKNLTSANGSTVILYAVWQANTYTIVYNSNTPESASGSITETMPQVTHTYDTAKKLSDNQFTLTGWHFRGWAKTKTGAAEYTNGQEVKNLTSANGGAVTLYAVWQANTYKIVYNSNKPEGASGSITGAMLQVTHTYDTAKNLAANGYSLTGWHFRGWAENQNGEVKYTNGQEVKNLTSANGGIVTLYAVWQANTYTIVYNSNKPESASGIITETMPQVTHTYDQSKVLTKNDYSLTGWHFCGWAETKNGEVKYTNGEEVKNLTSANGGTVTLYAVWQANTYTIKYMQNKPSKASHEVAGSTAVSSHIYDQSKALTANGYSLTGWHFRGWAETENGEVKYTNGQEVKNLTSANGGAVTLYAVWQANTYKIVYNSNTPETASGSITETMPPVTHTYDQSKALTANGYSLTGWHFCGWAKTANGAAEYTNGEEVKNLTDKDGGTVTLYAVWQAKTYTIKFNTDGGNFVQETSATFDSVLPNAGVPARKGYRFCGYFSQAGGKGVQFYDASGKAAKNKTYTEDRNIELYAYWSVISYNIDLYSGGRYVKTLENVAFDHLRLPSAAALNLSREHYNFIGWNLYDNQDWKMFSADVVYTVGIGYEQGETVTLYAAWKEKNVYSVNYDANGGGGAPGVEQKHEDETFALSDTIPTRENYTFLGWARTPDANLADYPAGIVNKLTMGGEPITLYAVWERNPSLSFDANGGAFSSAPEIRYPAVGSEESIPSAAPEKAGHIFAGWSTKKDASIADYPADGSKKITMPDADTLLYAVWQKQKYTITQAVASSDFEIVGLLGWYEYESAATFTIQTAASATGKPLVYVNGELLAAKNGEYTFTVRGESHVFVAAADGSALTLVYSANGGTGAPYDNHVYQSGDSATIPQTTPTRYGYTFLGWAAEQNAEVAQYKKGETYTFAGASAVLYAVWKANAYTVVYNANGGAGDMRNGEFTFGTKGALAKNSFAKIGYTFVGWSLSQNGAAAYKDGAEIADLCAEENGTITLYAVWEQTVTQISFDAESGKENNGTLSVAYGEDLTGEKLTFPTRSGYKFAGYFTQRGGAGEEIFDAALNAVVSGGWNKNLTALTLYAGWQPISYTIVYMNGADKVKSQTAVYDTSFNLLTAAELAITPSQAYHHFAGWTTAPSGQVVMYADGQKISDPLSATDGEEVIFYAVFAENEKYSVLYNANGGSNAPVDANTYYAGETVTFSTVKPEKEGYNFEGWSFDPNGGALIHAETVMQEGGITLYAVWQAGETLTEQINAVKSANASLKTSLDSLTGTVTGENGLSEKIADLLTRMNAAESTLNSLGATYATIAALNTEINTLKSTLAAADASLSDRISAVEKRLTAEAGNLTNLISQKANQSDFTSLKEAFDNAKTLLDSEIETRGKKDAELAAKITALQSSYDTLSQKLTKEIQKVTDTIQAKVTELKEGKADKTALTELSEAFDHANRLLNGQIADLFSEHDILNGTVASLETTYDQAIAELRQQISGLNTQLTAAVSDLTNKKADKTALTELSEAYKAADTILKGELENRLAEKDAALKGELAALKDEIAKLKVSYAEADTALQEKINDVQRQLNEAAQKISDLNGQKANQSDFASLKESFESAEALLNSEIAARTNKDDNLDMKDAELEAKDAKLEAKIADLTNALHTAQSALETKINEVTRRLDEAIRDLNASIASNASNVEEKLAAAKRAYEAADVVICGEIASLKDKDTELSGQISALELSCKAADEALWAGIRQVQENLESLRAGMESKNNELGNDIDSVGAENERLIFLNVVFYVVLGVTVLTSVLVSKVRKPLKKHRK